MTKPNMIPKGNDLVAYVDRLKQTGQTTRQIADSLGMTFNQLRWKLYRARKQTREPETSVSDPLPETDVSDRVSVKSEGNYLEIETNAERIKTLDDLLSAAAVDLDEWRVERYIVNKWEVGAKTARRKIEWKDGQIVDGFLDDPGELTIEPLWQVKAWLIRKNPIPIEPVISPISIQITKLDPPYLRPSDQYRRALIVPDIQTGYNFDRRSGTLDPFHDRRALDIALQFAEIGRFDDVIFLGDVLDLPDFSDKFLRTPEFTQNTQAAIVELSWWLSQFRLSAPNARIAVIEGNHEIRLINSIRAHLPAAYGLKPATEIDLPPALSVERLLGLPDLKIEYLAGYPDAGLWLNDGLYITHGDVARNAPGETAKQLAQKSDASILFGHIHRIERAARTATTRNGRKTISAVSPGCVCRLGGIVPGDKMKNDWQQGLAVVTYDPRTDFHMIETVEIIDGLAIYAGEIFDARDRLAEMIADTRWNF